MKKVFKLDDLLTREQGQLHFKYQACGACCSHLKAFGALYADLDDGSGVCRHYDKATKLCKIYATRPLKCRVEEGYGPYFASQIAYEDYLYLTAQGCLKLMQLYPK